MRVLRVILCLAIAIPVALLALPLGDRGERTTPGHACDAGSSDALAELEDVLDEASRAWNPRVRARIAARARGRLAVIGPPLSWMLSTPRHPRLPEAIDLAVALEFETAQAPLLRLATTAPLALRPVALRAAFRLRALPAEELVTFFASGDVAMRRAAVELAAPAGDELLPEVLAMLGDREAVVRDVALAALPDPLPASARERLMELARFAESQSRITYLRALGLAPIDAATEAFLVDELRMGTEATRAAALDALGSKGEPLRERRHVWDLATHMANDPLEQARAWRCIEQTRSFDAADIRRDLDFVRDPLSRLFCARCLILAGDRLGLEILVELLAADRTSVAALGEADAVRASARRLLGALVGKRVQATPAEWRRWLAGIEFLPAFPLGPSALEF